MIVDIDQDSGFCFGVLSAIGKAEEELAGNRNLYCLGDIVHNGMECERLSNMGLTTISHEQFRTLKDAKVLLRAHGEPPATYDIAAHNNITLIDATCPVVLKLQKRIKEQFSRIKNRNRQIVIFGQKGHAEVMGLVGQTEGTAIVVESEDDDSGIDFGNDIFLYSQTTKSSSEYEKVIRSFSSKMKNGATLTHFNTICGQVSHRREHIRNFASSYDVVMFVSGQKSSNGKILLKECMDVNPRTYSIEGPQDIRYDMFCDAHSIGICGATSTPKWLMEECREKLLLSVDIQQLSGGSK